VKDSKFIGEVCGLALSKLGKMTNDDLFNMAKASHYMKDELFLVEFYERVHDECVKRRNLNQFSQGELE